jgi:hypothetical protein
MVNLTKKGGVTFEDEINLQTYVYFISDGTAIKIGKSDNPNKRMNSLQIGNPRELSLLGTTPLITEEEVHILFKDLKIRGEWFENHQLILDYCKCKKTKHYELSIKPQKELIQMILDLEGKCSAR